MQFARRLQVFVMALACAAAGAALAQSDRASAPKLSKSDIGFIKQAAENGHAEVQSSKIALQKATDPGVKSFAQKMVDDHTKAGSELEALASAKGVELPKEPSIMQRGKLKMLSTTDGDNFNRRYAESMGVEAHKDTIKMFEKAASSSIDPEVRAFATKTLPTLKEHLTMAQGVHAAVAKPTEGAVTARKSDGSKADGMPATAQRPQPATPASKP